MKYMGSKGRHAKEIIPFLMDKYDGGMLYIEPFVGGANMFDKVPIPNELKYGCDIHHYLVEMWKAVSNGWNPPEVFTEDEYNYVKNHKDINKPLTGYVGFALSFGAKWFGGWSRDKTGRDYVGESYRNAQKQFPLLRGAKFAEKSVFDIKHIEKKSLIYCDPPYRGTTKYKDDFDHEKFYDWCRTKVREGHVVFVSEYWMPEDFKCVWEKRVAVSFSVEKKGKKNTEKLFILEG